MPEWYPPVANYQPIGCLYLVHFQHPGDWEFYFFTGRPNSGKRPGICPGEVVEGKPGTLAASLPGSGSRRAPEGGTRRPACTGVSSGCTENAIGQRRRTPRRHPAHMDRLRAVFNRRFFTGLLIGVARWFVVIRPAKQAVLPDQVPVVHLLTIPEVLSPRQKLHLQHAPLGKAEAKHRIDRP